MSHTPYDYDAANKKVTVRGAKTFPREIFDIADQVEILDMSGGELSALPEDLGRLTNLRIAFFSDNPFEEVPQGLAGCEKLEMVGFRSCNIASIPERSLPPGLRGLILTDNRLTKLPRFIGTLTNLQKLMVAGNQLGALPRELLDCRKLEMIRVSVNDLTQSPDWLFELPRLAWYADSSNPSSNPTNVRAKNVRDIAWDDIETGEQLGKSANNVVYRGHLKDGRVVAIKLFGHDLATDGLAADDMNACLLVGTHHNVVGGIGRLVGEPDGRQGLVMPLLPEGSFNLAKPPDLMTLTRDVYPADRTFSPLFVRSALRSVADALKHLHSHGVMHGDLYAHNVLSEEDGNSFLSDFGAASIYSPGSPEGALRERIDVRAFGILAEELLGRCATAPDEIADMDKLRELARICQGQKTSTLPSAAQLVNTLTSLA